MATIPGHIPLILSVDVGQTQDFTAAALLETAVWVRGIHTAAPPAQEMGGAWISPRELSPDMLRYHLRRERDEGRPPYPPLSVSHLHRYSLGTRYTVIAEHLAGLLKRPPLAGKRVLVLVDATGVGAGPVEMLDAHGVPTNSVTIHGGSSVSRDPHRYGFRVPKQDLVAAVQVVAQNRRLSVAPALPEAATLKRELANFKHKVDPKTAHDSYTHWREGDHDDLVLATAMAVWFREWSMALWERSYLNKQRRQAEEEESAQPKGSLLYPPSRSKKPTSPEEEARQLAASRIGSTSPSVRRYGAL